MNFDVLTESRAAFFRDRALQYTPGAAFFIAAPIRELLDQRRAEFDAAVAAGDKRLARYLYLLSENA